MTNRRAFPRRVFFVLFPQQTRDRADAQTLTRLQSFHRQLRNRGTLILEKLGISSTVYSVGSADKRVFHELLPPLTFWQGNAMKKSLLFLNSENRDAATHEMLTTAYEALAMSL